MTKPTALLPGDRLRAYGHDWIILQLLHNHLALVAEIARSDIREVCCIDLARVERDKAREPHPFATAGDPENDGENFS